VLGGLTAGVYLRILAWLAKHQSEGISMKIRLLSFVALFALLLVSTAILADGRPTGLRIGRLVSGGGTNVELDVTVTGTNFYYGGFSSTVWLGNEIDSWYFGFDVSQFESSNYSVPLPWAIDWGDGDQVGHVRLFSDNSSGPWRGTFAHTYSLPGSYQVTVRPDWRPAGARVELKLDETREVVIRLP